MWDIAVENPSFPMLECDKLCQQNAKCTGYYFDYTGCYPQSESCAVTDAPDYYPIQMDRDLCEYNSGITAVIYYLESKRLLLFGIAERYIR